jgi:phosphatidylglycerophosphate synthase
VAQVDAADLASRTAARAGDGFYSTFVLRRIAARLTPWAVRRGIQANAVTVLSALIGVVQGPCRSRSAPTRRLALGALLLQVSIVLDCVDGEIARVTRTRSPFGAWLDAATDRLKEYAALAGLAIAAGPHFWWVATAGMVVQTGPAHARLRVLEGRSGRLPARPGTRHAAAQRHLALGAARGQPGRRERLGVDVGPAGDPHAHR